MLFNRCMDGPDEVVKEVRIFFTQEKVPIKLCKHTPLKVLHSYPSEGTQIVPADNLQKRHLVTDM